MWSLSTFLFQLNSTTQQIYVASGVFQSFRRALFFERGAESILVLAKIKLNFFQIIFKLCASIDFDLQFFSSLVER